MKKFILAAALLAVACENFQGEDGHDGFNGPPGPQGDVGPQGPAGADGSTGSPGAMGTPGEDGVDGKDGLTGESSLEEVNDLYQCVLDKSENFITIACFGAPENTTTITGSGTVLCNGNVRTARHVVANPEFSDCGVYAGNSLSGPILLGTLTGSRLYLSPDAQAADQDINDVVVNWLPGLQPQGLCPSAPTEPDLGVGDLVLGVGHPLGLYDLEYTSGRVTATNVYEFGPDWSNSFLTDHVTAGGSSGGPVFDTECRFIGVLVGGFTIDSQLGLSICLPNQPLRRP